jgi:hypothetical protein
MSPKSGKSKPTQLWKLEREDKGFLLKNVKSKNYFTMSGTVGADDNAVVVELKTFDRKSETPASFIFKLNSIRHECTIEPIENDAALQPIDKKVKGVTTTFIAMDSKGRSPSAAQLWKLIETK